MSQQYEILYNLVNYQNELFLPEAFIIVKDENGNLTYAQNKVNAVTITDYGMQLTPERKQLFDIIDRLQIPLLENKFKKPNRKKQPLWKLLEVKETKPLVLKHIHRELANFLSIIVKNDFLLGLDVERKDWIEKKQIATNKQRPAPDLLFRRTKEGVFYQLKLSEIGYYSLRNRDLQVITNTPAWIVVGNQLYNPKFINGNMLKPFGKKDGLFIRNSFVKEYFQKFITKVVSKVEVEAQGFDILQHDQLKGCEISLVKDFLNGTFGLKLEFIYPQTRFAYLEKRNSKTNLEFNDGDDIIIHRHLRNEYAEQSVVKQLKGLGLKNGQSPYFGLADTTLKDPYPLLQWLTDNQDFLKKANIQVGQPRIEEKKILLAEPKLNLNLQQVNDWFDIFGVVEIGEYTIPFIKLANYIRNDDRFYPLPNGEYFIIPEEWMNRYRTTFEMGRVQKNALRLTKSQYPILKGLTFDQQEGIDHEDLEKAIHEVEYTPSANLKATLRPYQLEGVKWLIHLYQNQLGACLADDMGLGKTLQTIAALIYAKDQKTNEKRNDNKGQAAQLNMFSATEEDNGFYPLNALIILPASLVFNWERELKKFAPHLIVYKHTGPKRYKDIRILSNYDVILTTYQTTRNDIDLFRQINFEYVVLDESQQIKNKDSKVFKAINKLQANHKVSLSGTPIENSLADLWSQMQFINPDLLGNFPFFKKEFITPIQKQDDDERKDRLKTLIAPYMLRRTKEMVAKDLPPLTEKVFYTEMTKEQRKLYEKEKSAARNFILENFQKGNPKFNTKIIQTLLRLRQIANHPKLYLKDSTIESGKFTDMMQHLDVIRRGKHKTLIFSQFVTHLELFKAHFEKKKHPYSWLTGASTSNQRQRAIDDFEQQKEISSFLISLKAGGTGLNLTAADYVFIADPWWNPSAEKQAIARAHRIGQTKNVIAIKFIAKDTIEEKILQLQERKLRLADEFVNKNDKMPFSRKDLDFLLG